jgi:hypothetical protein
MNVLNAGEFKAVRLADLVVPAYQRDGRERSARNVADHFDAKLLQALTLVEVDPQKGIEEDDNLLIDNDQYRTGKLYLIVDGLQRATGIATNHPNGDVDIMAQVFRYVSRDEQINLFVASNRGSVRVKDYWIYKAKLSSGHPGILAINDVLVKTGHHVMNGGAGSNKGTNGIPGIAMLTKFSEVNLAANDKSEANPDSLVALEKALDAINVLWPKGLDTSSQRTNTVVLFGLAQVFRYGERANDKPLAVDEVVQQLRKAGSAKGIVTPGHLIARGNKLQAEDATTSGGSSGGSNSMLKYVIQAWLELINKGMKTQRVEVKGRVGY